MKIDIHAHTTASACSRMTPQQLASAALRLNLEVVVITNHGDSFRDRDVLRKILEPHGVKVFSGIEISTDWGDFLLFGNDLLAFEGMTGTWKNPLPRGQFPVHLLPCPETAVVWAHPSRISENYLEDIKWKVAPYIDAVEVLNGNPHMETPESSQRAYNLAIELKKPMIAASDAHNAKDYFSYATEFLTPVESYADLVKAVKSGDIKIDFIKK